MTSESESEQSDDEPVKDLENGLPILILGADEPIPKHSFASSARVSRTRKKPKTYRHQRSSLSARPRRRSLSGSEPVSQNAVSSGYDEIPQEPQSNDSDSDNLMDTHFDFSDVDQNDAVDNIMEDEDAGMLHTVAVNSDLKDMYMMEVLQAKAFMTIDVHHMKFLIQNFDQSLKQLMIHNFCITERWIFTLANEQCWILTCSCNASHERYVKNLDRKLDICENEFRTIVMKQFTECLHIKVCYDLVKMSDSLNCIDPLERDKEAIQHGYGKDLRDIQEVPFSHERLILVKPQNRNYAVVGFDRKGYVCYACTVYRHSCIHITCVTDMLKEDEDKLADFLVELAMEKTRFQNSQIQSRVQRSVSTEKIQWETTEEQQRVYQISSGRAEFDNDMVVLLACDNGVCPDCNSELSAVSTDDVPHKRLLLWASVMMVAVISRRCSFCAYTKEYCGSSEGILNMGSFLIGHDVMRDYMYLFLTGSSCSLIGFYEKWKLTFRASGSQIDNIISYQQLRFSWYSFLNLLDIDFKDGFTCDICGPYPDVITCDATTLGFKRNFMPSPALSTSYEPVNALGGR